MKKYYFHAQKPLCTIRIICAQDVREACSHTEHTDNPTFWTSENIESFFINGCLGQDWQEE